MNREQEIAHAREVDTTLAGMWDAYWKLRNSLKSNQQSIKDAQEYIDLGYDHAGRYAKRIEALRANEPMLVAEVSRAADVAREFDEANYTGWTRFFLVKHIHSNRYCSSFRATTRVGWLPDVSGLTEAEAVAEHGATLCTICFPSAPVELTTAALDPSLCTGSGGPYDKERLTGRERSYYSPAGYCPVCGEWTSLTARYSAKLRKHKAKVA
jgi:hypothetical protein